MFKLLLKFCVCVSMACHSAILPNFTNFDMQDVIKSEFDVNFKQLKRDYLDRISQLKEEAINCTPTGTHFNANEKIGVTMSYKKHYFFLSNLGRFASDYFAIFSLKYFL